MHLVCPHCQNSIDVESISTTKEIVCDACGSTIRLESASTAAWSPTNDSRKLGKFELLDQVGFGAFGTVFKARDPELDRIVAIKVPRSGNLATGEDLHRFLREARSVARLRHPSIVPVYEVGQADSLPYLVSEFVQGMTLADLMTARRLPPERIATLLAEVADALQYAHDQGVIHRDVKPSNILLDKDNHPHLMDFGLAKRDAGEVSMTLEGQILGTPAYMSPEQASGEARHVDGRSDVYSLGVILYQLLTGELPFKGNPRALLHQVQHEDPPPPRRLAKDIPADLETICLKAIARERESRYATAKALAEDLRRFVNGEPILARPPRAWSRGLRWIKRNRTTVAGVAVGMALGALLIPVLYLSRSEKPITQFGERINQPEPEPSQTAPKKDSPEDAAKEAAPAPLPADLELIRRDGAAFVTVRVADLAGQQGVKRLMEALEKFPGLGNAHAWEDGLEKTFGARPAQMERLAVFIPPAKNAPGSIWNAINVNRLPPPPANFSSGGIFIGTVTEPYDRKKLLAWLGSNPQEKTHQGKAYYLATSPQKRALHFLTDRLVIVSGSEEALQAFLVQSPGEVQWGQLHHSLALSAQRYQCAFGVNLRDPSARLVFSVLMQGFLQGINVSGTSANLKPTLDAFADMQTAVLLLGLRSGSLSGDKVQLRLRLGYKDAERAKLGVNEVRDLLIRIEAPLRVTLQTVLSNPRLFEQMGTESFLHADAMRKIFGVYEQFFLALKDVEINAERNVIDIRFPDLAIDLSGFATAVGEIVTVRPAVTRVGKLAQLGVALEDYVAEHHRLPPPAITGPNGEPLLSWRVALLRYLGEKDLYMQFKLNEPWDSVHNKKLLERMPEVYARDDAKKTFSTGLRVYTGPGTAFEGREGVPLGEITDGLPSTLLIAQTNEEVPWTKPEELSLDPKQPLRVAVEQGLFADGAVRFLFANSDAQTRQGIITRNGGEKIDLAGLPIVQPGTILNDAAWRIARGKQNSADRYRWGVRLADKAARLNPKNGDMQNTLGVSQYRAGRYADALATLTRSQQINAGLGNSSHIADLAFLALTEERLGHHEQAVSYLGRLREELKKPNHAGEAESRDFLHEAETLIEGRANKKS
jgi:serine/threonine protein kinase